MYQNIPIVIVGAKSDLVSEREVQIVTISNLSQKWALPFFETSAKKNWRVADAFEDLIRQMRNCYPKVEHEKPTKTTSGDVLSCKNAWD